MQLKVDTNYNNINQRQIYVKAYIYQYSYVLGQSLLCQHDFGSNTVHSIGRNLSGNNSKILGHFKHIKFFESLDVYESVIRHIITAKDTDEQYVCYKSSWLFFGY